MRCGHCGSEAVIKRGLKNGYQRFVCRGCGRYGTDKQPRFTVQTRAMAIEMYMNSMGIRAIGRVLGASPAAVLNWIRKEHALMQHKLAQAVASDTGVPDVIEPDVIEMDEIYTYVQKNSSAR